MASNQGAAMQMVGGILLAALAAGPAVFLGMLYSTGSADLPAQDLQPVDFSHRLHAGRLQIDCLFCHRHATHSPAATVPSMKLCMSCHRSLSTQTPETEKLLAYWKRQEPIRWARLQRLPEHVYFTHEMHLKAGVHCADCHGRVERMRGTPRAPTYLMGWCLSCHRQREASQDCWTCHK